MERRQGFLLSACHQQVQRRSSLLLQAFPAAGHINIKEAIQGYIVALKEDGLSVPEERFDTLLVAV